MQYTKTSYITHELNLKNIKKVTLLIIYVLFAFYFLVNGPGLFDEWNQNWTWNTLIYMSGVSLFLIVSIMEKLPGEFETPLLKHGIGFMASFLGASLLFWVLYDLGVYFTEIQPMPLGQIIPTIFFQMVIVVASEEIIFRGVIFQYFSKYFHWVIGMLVSAILFSLFHLAVYEGSMGALWTAFLMGLVFAWAVKRWNLGVAMGLHLAWNLMVLGVTALI